MLLVAVRRLEVTSSTEWTFKHAVDGFCGLLRKFCDGVWSMTVTSLGGDSSHCLDLIALAIRPGKFAVLFVVLALWIMICR